MKQSRWGGFSLNQLLSMDVTFGHCQSLTAMVVIKALCQQFLVLTS